MIKPIEVLKKIDTQKILLFHSATGKDSICLLNLTYNLFEVTPVHMYIVKGLSFVESYIAWAENKYKVKFIQVPHFMLSYYLKNGTLGIKKNKDQKIFKLMDIAENVTNNTGIKWQIYGFKQSDGLNRRLMLRTYEDFAINRKTNKVYPLTDWKNKDCLKYIKDNRLIQPLNFGIKERSSGLDINDPIILKWVKTNYPADYNKIVSIFPECDIICWNHENKTN
jgi:3'-phosphoadenosine 5'-phosphosulfate sulfotransferase (PAPS reductase)/FAD synthetase